MCFPVASSTSNGKGFCRGAWTLREVLDVSALLGPEIQGKLVMVPPKLPGLTQSLVQSKGVQPVLQPLAGSRCPKPELGWYGLLLLAQHGHHGYSIFLKKCEEKAVICKWPCHFCCLAWGSNPEKQHGHLHWKYSSWHIVTDGLWPRVGEVQQSHPLSNTAREGRVARAV